MKISVFSLFRDSDPHIKRTLKQFEDMTLIEGVDFEFFFYENDSKDHTRYILKDWCSNNNGKLIYEDLGFPKFGSIMSTERFILLAYYRNKLKDSFINDTDSEYSIIVDSDLVFDNSCIHALLKYKDHNSCSLMTSNSRNVQMGSVVHSLSDDCYYDVGAFINSLGDFGRMLSDCPSLIEEDVEKWKRLEPIKITSGFGSMAITKTEYLRQVKWSSRQNIEHVSFCFELSKFGPIYACPKARCFLLDGYMTPENIHGVNIREQTELNIYNKYKNL